MNACFGISYVGTVAAPLFHIAKATRCGQRVGLICGCEYAYVDGERSHLTRLCYNHHMQITIMHATLINRELACCRN